MRIITIADTHKQHKKLIIPKGDVLVFAGDGDFIQRKDYLEFLDWFSQQHHTYKIIVAGNHDYILERNKMLDESKKRNIIYLQNNECIINGLKFWGSPYTPRFGNWAFMKERGEKISDIWAQIPTDVDVLITHGPPMYRLDMTMIGEPAGCWDLNKYVERIKPKLHIFGHIHNQSGIVFKDDIYYVNASVMNDKYNLTFLPKIIDIDKNKKVEVIDTKFAREGE